MTCILCGKETSFFSSHKTMDGIVCKECYKKIPSLLFKDSKNQSESAIRIAKESAENNFEQLPPTVLLDLMRIMAWLQWRKRLINLGNRLTVIMSFLFTIWMTSE